MILIKGDEVKLKTGETAEIIETWGIARSWCKLQMKDGSTRNVMADKIESVRRKGKSRWKP